MLKKALFFSIIIAFNYLALEAIAYSFYRIKYGDYQPQALLNERLQVLENADDDVTYGQAGMSGKDIVVSQATHPYVGYVVDGKRRFEGCETDDYACFERIKTPIDGPMLKRNDKQFIVGVFGGSVAVGTFNGTNPGTYQKYIQEHVPAARGKEVVLLGMAAGGYKQPQQLMQLNYMLASGAEFDLIINIDGFNEIAIPSSEYKRAKLHPSFPRAWEHRVSKAASPEFLELYSRSKIAKDRLRKLANWSSKSGINKSPTVNLLWKLRSISYNNEIAAVTSEVEQLESSNKPRDFRYAEVGPAIEFTDWDEFNKQSILLWMQSSYLMSAAAKAHNTPYFHFLQPNQYVDGSKALTAREEKEAILKNQGYGWRYKLAYPMIKEMHHWLSDQGVEYYDLTHIYQNERGTIYIDNCCHVNKRGSNLIIKAVTERIGERWQ